MRSSREKWAKGCLNNSVDERNVQRVSRYTETVSDISTKGFVVNEKSDMDSV